MDNEYLEAGQILDEDSLLTEIKSLHLVIDRLSNEIRVHREHIMDLMNDKAELLKEKNG